MNDPRALLHAEFGDRFELREAYAGGEGTTLRVAAAAEPGGDLVLKVLPPGVEPEEAALLVSLRHPAIPAVVEVGRLRDGRAFVLREHVAGTALKTLPANPAALLEVARDVLAILAYVHLRGIAHLDLKPANLVVGDADRLFLLDFGLAARAGERSRGGTVFFAAPELLLGATPDARADLFSLGAMVAQALWPGGQVPLARILRSFPRDDFWTAAGVRPRDFPPAFAPFLERCLARHPDRRFPDAQAAMEFLCGGSGRPAAGLLTPDPGALWQPEVAAIAAAAGHDRGGDVVVRGAEATDRRAIAMHLAATCPGCTAIAEHPDEVLVVRAGGPPRTLVLPQPDAGRLAPHLVSAFGLEGAALEAGVRWLAAQRCAGAAAMGRTLTALIERGEVVAAGSRWTWVSAQSGRLGDLPPPPDAATPESIRGLAARGRREAALAAYRRGVERARELEVELRHAVAEGLLDGGEPANALPLCADAPMLRAQALLDMGQVTAAERILAQERSQERAPVQPRRRKVEAQLLLARGEGDRAVGTLVEPLTVPERLTLAAALETTGRLGDCERELGILATDLRGSDRPFLRASWLSIQGHLARRRGDLAAAAGFFAEAATTLFGVGHLRHAATAHLNLGVIAKDRGDRAEAIARLREARTLYGHAGDGAGEAIAMANLGNVELAFGDAAAARRWLEQAADRLEQLGSHEAGRLARAMLARACAALGDGSGTEQALAAIGEPGTARLRQEVEAARAQLAAHRSAAAAPGSADPPANVESMPSQPGPDRALFRTFLAVNRQLAQETDLDKAMRHLLDAAVTLTGGRKGYLLVTREDGLRREFDTGDGQDVAQAFSRSLAHRALERQRTLTGIDALADRELQEAPSIRNLEVRSAVCTPFHSAGGVRGAIYVEHPGRADVFDDGDKEALEILADQAAIAVDRMLREEALAAELKQSRRELAIARRGRQRPIRLLGESRPMQALRDEIERLAPLDLPVLVQGETGTGKELVARALHDRSPRRRQPFVAENCSALPGELLERELFGHVKGAFTGADADRPGLLELANGGTLFLDEVGDMSGAMQAKLLRALQERSIRRVGGSETIQLDFRLVAATHKDIRAMIAASEFREDLFFRLAAVELRVPPVRERGPDIVALAEHFLAEHARELGRPLRFGAGVTDELTAYSWPGNVRELEHLVARAALLAETEVVEDLRVPREVARAASATDATSAPNATGAGMPVLPLKEVERLAIAAALQHFGGDKAKTARALGISRTALYEKIKRYEIG